MFNLQKLSNSGFNETIDFRGGGKNMFLGGREQREKTGVVSLAPATWKGEGFGHKN